MEWTEAIAAVVAAVGSGGGVAAFYRARGQNKADLQAQIISERSQLSQEQVEFRKDMAVQIAALRQEVADQEKNYERLLTSDHEKATQITRLSTLNDLQSQRLTELSKLNDSQQQQIGILSQRVSALESEKAQLAQLAQIAESKAEFLERENNVLREELRRIQAKLPARVETARLQPKDED